MARRVLAAIAALLLLGLQPGCAAAWTHGVADAAPSAASGAGYLTETFAINQNFSSANVDLAKTYAQGFQFYYWNFFSETVSSTAVVNADGSITVKDGPSNGTLVSAAQTVGSPFFVGTAFGGGAYFEAELSFDPNLVNNANGWPAWWGFSLEKASSGIGDQWAGQAAGYDHWVEPDFFESYEGSSTFYDRTVHEFYGIWNTTNCPPVGGTCQIQNTSTTTPSGSPNFNTYHKYGFLWVPATASVSGSLCWYFDGVQQGSCVTYSQFTNQSPTPVGQPWAYGVIDQQHILISLGSGSSSPMTVKSVKVWQASAAANLHN